MMDGRTGSEQSVPGNEKWKHQPLTILFGETFEHTNAETLRLRLRTDDYGRQLFVITNEGDMLRLYPQQTSETREHENAMLRERTPRMRGTNDAGSVDIDASSMKTSGK